MATQLELLHHASAKRADNRPPVLLLHGAFAGAWCWQDTQACLAESGWESYALSLSGHGNSSSHTNLHLLSLDDFLRDVRAALAQIGEPCVVVGHSLGGYLAQHLARHEPLAGLALLASVPAYGLSGSLAYMGSCHPGLLLRLQQFAAGILPDPGMDFVRALLFADETPPELLQRFADKVQLESITALSELMLPRPWSMLQQPHDFPVLVLGAGSDRIIPCSDVLLMAQSWGVRPIMIAEAGHAMMCDPHADEMHHYLLGWLNQAIDGQLEDE